MQVYKPEPPSLYIWTIKVIGSKKIENLKDHGNSNVCDNNNGITSALNTEHFQCKLYNFLGFIFKEQREGTEGLYSGYNSSRNDTRTQIGNKFESGYSSIQLLGYIYTGES